RAPWAAPLLPTTKASVWLIPNWWEAARAAPAGGTPVGLTPNGPLQGPPPWTQTTWTAPLLPTTKTSVWFGIPNWLEAASREPGEIGRASRRPSAPLPGPPPTTQTTWAPQLLTTTTTACWSRHT